MPTELAMWCAIYAPLVSSVSKALIPMYTKSAQEGISVLMGLLILELSTHVQMVLMALQGGLRMCFNAQIVLEESTVKELAK